MTKLQLKHNTSKVIFEFQLFGSLCHHCDGVIEGDVFTALNKVILSSVELSRAYQLPQKCDVD